MLGRESLEEFKLIILEEYGIELTDEQAYQDATVFLEAIKILVDDNSLIQKKPIDTPSKEDGNVSESAS